MILYNATNKDRAVEKANTLGDEIEALRRQQCNLADEALTLAGEIAQKRQAIDRL